ncbi:MAG: hypothetical protein HY077_11700 [Elusimicrobia bacterium]|nr:hypothetical protein [Elusimicrobiota bacterium]
MTPASSGKTVALALAVLTLLGGVALRAEDEQAYDRALEKYQEGDFAAAARLLSAKSSKTAGDLNLLGWATLKAGDPREAIVQFTRSLSLDSSATNSYCGIGYAYYRQGLLAEALESFKKGESEDSECASGKAAVLRKLDAKDELAPGLLEAESFVKRGDNAGAARVYVRMLDAGIDDGRARHRLLAIYGWPAYNKGQRLGLPPRSPALQTAMTARARGDYLEVLEGGVWEPIYVKGVNLGPARPGEFPSTPPLEVKTYLDWLAQIVAMNCNTVRAYTILPPAFYRALKIHNDGSDRKLWLLQEVWLTERDDELDLYSKSWSDDFRKEIEDNIDALHGNADIPYRPGHAWGVYTADVSRFTLGLGVGRELEPAVALTTNARHQARTAYKGRYISVARGNPAEVWFGEMADHAAAYEMQIYNSQRPITLINWPPLDPIFHPTEATYPEEVAFRRKRGEKVSEVLTRPLNDTDAVSLDVNALQAGADFPAKVFASFHVYSHWPNFLFTDPEYPKVRDDEGSNRYYGYLLDLKRRYKGMPLLVAEYGIATSWGTAHLHPDGWGNGGLNEKEQARLLVRMSKNIRDARCAGGIVFEWQDEWWKRVSDYFTRGFASDLQTKPLWLNLYDPEEMFGLLGYRSAARVPLLRGREEDWAGSVVLASAPAGGPWALRSLRAASDQVFLYFRVDADNRGAGMDGSKFALLLDTMPGKAGSRKIPGLDLRIESGANFLISLSSSAGSILIAEAYNPNQWHESGASPGAKEMWRKVDMQASLEDESAFGEIITETNAPHWSRDGTVFPPLFASRSPLKAGTADPDSADYDNQAAWHFSPAEGMLEVRIPWGLLYFMNPAGKLVFAGTKKEEPYPRETEGVSVVAVRLGTAAGGKEEIASALPPLVGGRLPAASVPVYSWKKWDTVAYEAFFKPSYLALKELFGRLEPLK